MFSLLSIGSVKTAEYWEGWQAVEQHRTCPYTDQKQRKDWAKGFSDGVGEERDSKVWYKSRTMIVGLSLLVIGTGLAVYGIWAGGGQAIAGFGTGITTSSILMSALRLITKTDISFSSGGQYAPPPVM
jgi:ribosome modulation factor